MADDLYFSVPDVEGACARAEALYNRVYAALQAVLPGTAIVQHIGATSIPGCLTKGDLDIVVRVQAGDFDQVDAILEGMFARNTGSVRTKDFAAFENPDFDPPLGVQLTTFGGEYDDLHYFADALRSDPALLEQYNALKRAYEGKLMDEYRAAKDRFVASVLHRP
jgi:GrpB-like predicted nucleotidyltransferase (UPF0157 family)